MINRKTGGYTHVKYIAPAVFVFAAYAGGRFISPKDVQVVYKRPRSITINY